MEVALKNATKLSDKKYLQNKMFNYKYMSEEDIVKLLLLQIVILKIHMIFIKWILINITDRKFERLKKIIEPNYPKFEGLIKTALKTSLRNILNTLKTLFLFHIQMEELKG